MTKDDFTEGQEYELTWRIPGVHRKDRTSRMGFLGLGGVGGYDLMFDARGPDRSTKHPYAGTQSLNAAWISSAVPVDKDKSKRYAVRK